MKQLFWKEWYELRLLPVGACLCTALILIIIKIYDKTYGGISAEVIAGTLPVVCLLFTAMAGAGLISQEVGTSTLQLLTYLPSSRGRVWWVKAATAFAMVIFSVLCSAAVWAVICGVLFHTLFTSITQEIHRETLGNILIVLSLALSIALLVLLMCFTLALAVSSLFDRSLNASIFAVILSAAYPAFFTFVVNAYGDAFVSSIPSGHDSIRFGCAFLFFSIATQAAVSYWTFTRGESLRTVRRFRIAGLTGAVCLGLGSTIFLGGYLLHAW